MSSASSFEKDAFISYRHADNKLGWIDNFHDALEALLAGMLPWEPDIWRDPELPGNVRIADHLQGKIKQTAVLISILSSGYSVSEWCTGEFAEFCRHANESGGLTVDGKERIFKVLKTAIKREEIPEEIRDVTGYDFFEIDKSQKPREFNPEVRGPNKDQRFLTKLSDLAWDIKQVLETLKPRPPVIREVGKGVFAKPTAGTPKASVYLAETTYDLKETRDKIKRELQEHGYNILPDKDFPYVSPDYEEAVRQSLRQCKLSVHLIGETYGIIPDRASDSSVILLQNQIAADHSGDHAGFSRLIWMPKDLQPKDERQERFIEQVMNKTDFQRGAEVLLTPLDELNIIIRKRLTSTNGHKSLKPSVRKKIYLICDQRDVDDIVELNDYLIEKRYDVLLPLIDDETDDSQTIELHMNKLLQCDAILIYYGSANQRWLEQKLLDLEKIVGLEQNANPDRVKPLLATLVYVAGPLTSHKRLFNSYDPPTKKNFQDFSPADLDEFLSRIEGAERGGDDDDR